MDKTMPVGAAILLGFVRKVEVGGGMIALLMMLSTAIIRVKQYVGCLNTADINE